MDTNSKQFKLLQDKWYKKLEKEGFDDIEKLDHIKFQSEGAMFYSFYGHEKFKAKEEYYQLAGKFLHDYNFKNDIEKEIWRLYSEGFTIRQISTFLNLQKFKKSRVFNIVAQLKKEMIKMYVGANKNE
jgi:hypothetical protein